MPLERDAEGQTFVVDPKGQRTHHILNDIADPWKY
jgi:hypothetical protein